MVMTGDNRSAWIKICTRSICL